MTWRKILAPLSAVAAIVAVLGLGFISSAGAEPKPVCHSATLTENSGNGPTYHNVKFCDALLSGVNQLIVDGGPLKNRAVVFGSHVASPSPSPSPSTSTTAKLAATAYGDPNGPHWHCQEDGRLYSYDCISGYGWVYGGVWAYSRDFYQHPHPITDYVVNEPYFTPNGPNGLTSVPHYMRRVVIVEDGQKNALIEPVNWDASQNALHPAAPVNCMVLTGPDTGQEYPCTQLDIKSILDYWYQARVVTNPW